MKNHKNALLALVLLVSFGAGSGHAQSPEGAEIVAGVGLLNVFHDQESEQWMGSLECRFREWRWDLRPWIGIAQAEKGTTFVSAGLSYTHEMKNGVRLTAAFAPTFYDANNGRDLGSKLEYYTFGEVGYSFKNHHVLSLRLGHISNAGLAAHNPGVETLMLTYSLPLMAKK